MYSISLQPESYFAKFWYFFEQIFLAPHVKSANLYLVMDRGRLASVGCFQVRLVLMLLDSIKFQVVIIQKYFSKNRKSTLVAISPTFLKQIFYHYDCAKKRKKKRLIKFLFKSCSKAVCEMVIFFVGQLLKHSMLFLFVWYN